MGARLRASDVFVNCPFDDTYKPVFEAITFAIFDLGFVPRCALEVDDSSQVRLEKIASIIERCRYGIHDLSYVAIDPRTRLPRFNMPLELGLFLGCKRFGGKSQLTKNCLILDHHSYRYRRFMSDIAGQDIHAYKGTPRAAIRAVRDWVCAASKRERLPGGDEIYRRYVRFRKRLPRICKELRREVSELTFVDYSETARIWLQHNR
ncbi:MAG: hypothetical protein ACKV22_24275 [Bryobacteraceae bacterium]